MNHWFPDWRSSPRDEDWLTDTYVKSTRDSEYHDVTGYEGLTWILNNSDGIATPETLYTLKLSHSFWDIHWAKTMHDIKEFQKLDIQVNEELFKLLYKDFTIIHGKKRAVLEKANEEFFNDHTDRKYVHDDLHKAVAYYDKPMYEYIKKDLKSANVSYKMFQALSKEDKLKLCREEMYVVALERHLIPANFSRLPKKLAYLKSAKNLVTSMTKGWFPRYIVSNWQDLGELDDHDFVGLFKDSLNKQEIRRVCDEQKATERVS